MGKSAAFLLLAGLAVSQPNPGNVTPADVKRLAERLVRLDPSGSPQFSPDQLDALRRMLESNPELKAKVDRRLKDMEKLPPDQQRAKLDELKKTVADPQVKKQLDQMMPKATPKSDTKPAETGKGSPQADRQPPRPPQPESIPPSQPERKAAAPARPDPPAEPTPLPKSETERVPSAAPPPPVAAPRTGYEKFVRLWEQNVGPLNEMPAMQQLARELLRGRPDGTSAGDGGPLGDLIDAKTAVNLLKGLPDTSKGRSGWELPDLSGTPGGLHAPSLPSTSFGGPELPSAGGIGAVVGLAALVVLLIVLIRLLPRLTGTDDPRPVAGLGPWPLDPRTVETRADLVRAFEYLSVLLNGDPARTYSHEAAAAALRAAVPAAADAAGPLADAYALARYTPADQPLAAEEIADARQHLCRLAGVPSP